MESNHVWFKRLHGRKKVARPRVEQQIGLMRDKKKDHEGDEKSYESEKKQAKGFPGTSGHMNRGKKGKKRTSVMRSSTSSHEVEK